MNDGLTSSVDPDQFDDEQEDHLPNALRLLSEPPPEQGHLEEDLFGIWLLPLARIGYQ